MKVVPAGRVGRRWTGYTPGVTAVHPEDDPDARHAAERAQLLPEERAAGSGDPVGQADAILAESADRTEHPDPEASTQSSRRRSEETVGDDVAGEGDGDGGGGGDGGTDAPAPQNRADEVYGGA